MFRPQKIKWSDYRSKIVPDAKKQPIYHSQMAPLVGRECEEWNLAPPQKDICCLVKFDNTDSINIKLSAILLNKNSENRVNKICIEGKSGLKIVTRCPINQRGSQKCY